MIRAEEAQMSVLKKLSIVSYPVKNWEQAKKFYGETLGLPVAWFMTDEVGWIQYGDENGATLALSWHRDGDPPPNKDNGVVAIFDVDDTFKAVAELRAKGVRCDEPQGIPGMVTYANIYDPEGNRLQLAGPPPPA
jgi:catechol 2,3-dioxygenase-like lactoylglutathione lyase family enzyme